MQQEVRVKDKIVEILQGVKQHKYMDTQIVQRVNRNQQAPWGLMAVEEKSSKFIDW